MANLEPGGKCLIQALEIGVTVNAMFNPKEISIDKSVPWNKHKTSKGDSPRLEFTDAEPKTMSVELFFDTYESGSNVHTEHITKLEALTMIIPAKKRPPMCVFIWGGAFPRFMGVIEQLSVKYTMFFSDGTPCRATATLKLKQGAMLTAANDKSVPIDKFSDDGVVVGQVDSKRVDKFGPDHRKTMSDSGSNTSGLEPGQPVKTGG